MYRNYQFLKNFGHFMYDKINVLCCVIIGELTIRPSQRHSYVFGHVCIQDFGGKLVVTTRATPPNLHINPSFNYTGDFT